MPRETATGFKVKELKDISLYFSTWWRLSH